jgi:hypothetical protein
VATLVVGILVVSWSAARAPRDSTVDRCRPTLETAGVLAIIVVIRTALSFSLEVKLEGHWPWARTSDGGAPHQRVS